MKQSLFFLSIVFALLMCNCTPPDTDPLNNNCVADIPTFDSNHFCFETTEGVANYMAVFRPQDFIEIPCAFDGYKAQGHIKLFTGGIPGQTYSVVFPDTFSEGFATVSLSIYDDVIYSYWGISGIISATEENGKITAEISDVVMREATTGDEFILHGVHNGCN